MSSISSVLIRSCLSTIQKELHQLEHWLNHLPQDVPAPAPVNASTDIMALLEKISKQYDAQQHTLHHIMDRLDMLDSSVPAAPWLEEPSPFLENSVVEPDVLEPLYVVHKTEEQRLTPTATALAKIIAPLAPLVIPSVVPDAVVPNVVIPSVAPEAVVPSAPEAVVPLVVPDAVIPEAVARLAPSVVPNAVAPLAPSVVPNAVVPDAVIPNAIVIPSVPSEEMKEDEAEEEEEGVELVEVTFKGKTYYKDPNEGFIYGMDDEGQPSEQPIGVWKEKTQSVAFYRT